MNIKVGDRVRYKEGLWSGAQRRNQVGTVLRVQTVPTGAGPHVDIQFGDGIDQGISVHQIERAAND